jgi:hypothetical protein
VVLFKLIELLERASGRLALVVLKLGAAVIVLDTFPEIAGAELFNASPLPLRTREAGVVSRSGVGYALIAMTEAIGDELRPDEEKNNKLEATCLPVPVPVPLPRGDDDCGVPTAPSARVEFANGSNSHPNQENILRPRLYA